MNNKLAVRISAPPEQVTRGRAKRARSTSITHEAVSSLLPVVASPRAVITLAARGLFLDGSETAA